MIEERDRDVTRGLARTLKIQVPSCLDKFRAIADFWNLPMYSSSFSLHLELSVPPLFEMSSSGLIMREDTSLCTKPSSLNDADIYYLYLCESSRI